MVCEYYDSNIISSQRLIKSYCFIGIGMDSSITPLRHGGLSLVQTTDFFYPLVEDPYMQGKLIVRNATYAFAWLMITISFDSKSRHSIVAECDKSAPVIFECVIRQVTNSGVKSGRM